MTLSKGVAAALLLGTSLGCKRITCKQRWQSWTSASAVELLPEEQWRGPSTKLPTGAGGETAAGEGGEAEAAGEGAADGAHIAQVGSWAVDSSWGAIVVGWLPWAGCCFGSTWGAVVVGWLAWIERCGCPLCPFW